MRRTIAGTRSLITGASSGIGRHLALELARQGGDVVLMARRLPELESLATEIRTRGRKAVVAAGDVTMQADRTAALNAAQAEFGGLDVLINNAGVTAHGLFSAASPDLSTTIMQVNFFAAVDLTREALPLLQAGRKPMLVNIGSILGARGIPFNAEYCASKFALHGWTEAIRTELMPLGIDVLLATPGTTDTDFFSHMLDKKMELPWGSRRGANPVKVARAIVRAMKRGRRTVLPSLSGRALLMLQHLSPRLVDRIMRKYV
jgi:short-subunit dehydrogenase